VVHAESHGVRALGELEEAYGGIRRLYKNSMRKTQTAKDRPRMA